MELGDKMEIFDDIRLWAHERNLINQGDAKTQCIKLGEEYGELCHGIIKQNDDEMIDAIGDMVVVLTNLAAIKGWSIEDCIISAYREIANRKGKMVNGSFIKE